MSAEPLNHNLENPRCPQCGAISHKNGTIRTRKARKQRYRCIGCGLNFTEKGDSH